MIPRKFIPLVYWPVALTAFLIIWTVCVSPYSKYGDNWAIVPAFLVLPLVLVIHLALLIKGRWHPKLVAYGVLHTCAIFYIWMWCLMDISKDAL